MSAVTIRCKRPNIISRLGCFSMILAACPAAFCAASAVQITAGSYTSIQVNVNAQGQNIIGDVGNETTIAVNPNNPANIVVGWRRFDPPTGFAGVVKAGYAYTTDGGLTWNNGTLNGTAIQNQTDPVLAVDSQGNFYYQSLGHGLAIGTHVFKSTDGGRTWQSPPVYQFAGDKNWIAIDQTGGIGEGNIYGTWRGDENPDPNYVPKYFVRSTNQGLSYHQPEQAVPADIGFGQIAIGPTGEVYMSGKAEAAADIDVTFGSVYDGVYFIKSLNAKNPSAIPTFTAKKVDMGGYPAILGPISPNPSGSVGDMQIAADRSQTALRGNVYMMANLVPPGWETGDRMDIQFVRSRDGGETWSAPVRVNDDAPSKTAYQWFPMLGVAPNSRIDAVWYDTRNGGAVKPQRYSQLFYAYSWDGGVTWSRNQAVTPQFNTHLPYLASSGATELPRAKLGDYTHLVSDANGAHIAYAATFNGEHDVYYLNVFPDCNQNKISDVLDIQRRKSGDTNANHIPDSCEAISVKGDLDGDKDVDQLDLNALLNKRNKPASAGNDPMDLDRNGIINALDARKLTLLCTRPRCAVN